MLAFVVLHYQAIDETKSCIQTIKERVKAEKKIVVVDNCSPNQSGKQLHDVYQRDEEVEVILLESNLGFAKGNNIGYRAAKAYNPKYIIVINNDAFIDCDDLEVLIDRAYDETAFDILGPDIYSTRDHIHQNPHRMKNFTLEELKQRYKFLRFKNNMKFLLRIKYALPISPKRNVEEKEYINSPMENVVLHGACYIYSKPYIATHNNCMYDGTFMYYESFILHALAQRENLKLVYYPGIKIKHHEDIATNLSHGNGYKKTIFTNKCLEDSCRIFINIYEDDSILLS